MGMTKDIRSDLLALAVRDGAVIEQHVDGSRTIVPVAKAPVPVPATPPSTQWSD